MSEMDVEPGANRAPQCLACEEFRLAEAAANGLRDYSAATDCRVLLARHRESADCVAREAT